MAETKHRKHSRKKQLRPILDRIDKIAVAIFWIVKTVLLILNWLAR